MVMAQDVLAGYGQERRKPSTPILPYLREKAERENRSNDNPKSEAEVKKNEPTLDEYAQARRSILAGGE